MKARYYGMIGAAIIMAAVLMVTPDFGIEGVKEGKIYAKSQKIEVRNGFGFPRLLLNGKPISSGYEVKKNGKYALTVKERFFWKVKEETVHFERDDVPPRKPALKNTFRKVFFEEVLFDVRKQKNVKFEATLNGKAYDLSKPLTGEGDYILKLKANKQNGLTSEKTFEFKIDNTTYSQKDIDDFIQFYFHDPLLTVPNEIFKWTGKIAVVLHGDIKEKDKKAIDSSIRELNENLSHPMEVMSEKEAKNIGRVIDVHYEPRDKFNSFGFEGSVETASEIVIGFATVEEANYETGFEKAKVLVDTTSDQDERDGIILHELTHAVGLYNHFNTDATSIIHPQSTVKKLNERDRKMVDLLYREDLEIGMNEREVIKILTPRIEK